MYVLASEIIPGGKVALNKQCLFLFRTTPQNFFDVRAEADVQHPVCFIEHHEPELINIQRATIEVIDHAAGRADDNVTAPLQFVYLAFNRFATIQTNGFDFGRSHSSKFVFDLYGQFARRRENQRLRLRINNRHVQLFEDRDRERGGLSRTRSCLADDIVFFHHQRDHARLNWRWFFVANLRPTAPAWLDDNPRWSNDSFCLRFSTRLATVGNDRFFCEQGDCSEACCITGVFFLTTGLELPNRLTLRLFSVNGSRHRRFADPPTLPSIWAPVSTQCRH